MYKFDEVEERNVTVSFVVSLSNYELTLRQAHGEREDEDEDDEDEEREWCD